MQTMTKEQLRGLKAKIEEEKRIVHRNQNIKRLSDTIRQGVIQIASTGVDDPSIYCRPGTVELPKTRYFYNSNVCGRNVSDISDEVIEKLRESFPDCLIEYRETKAMDGRMVESGILVDWS